MAGPLARTPKCFMVPDSDSSIFPNGDLWIAAHRRLSALADAAPENLLAPLAELAHSGAHWRAAHSNNDVAACEAAIAQVYHR
jgi:hypothetical protein